ncbi:Uncharacterised protein [Corynebacterium renale]|uniref:tubulin-like doman-containing protein n=1 Tax=Corynebacterium renale TaxID=1724 RepID=UPI000DA409BA|nr:tubulin-like doman-containing protein [Corynebacterium renale]SQG63572.1 Uncharacterised protein [Corynebacterium renale]STD00978.1 Uncharacterised protein [Corynebacterium renale]
MKKFLVVGCGGSGAKTQAYMMDQLKAMLRAKGWTGSTLPQAWQFVSIDVPIAPEPGPGGIDNVKNAGGEYIGIGVTQQYRSFDDGVSRRLGAKGALGEIATWAPRNPEMISTPISAGAGQYRALGRMLTIPALNKIREELEAALERMHAGSPELDQLAEQLTGNRQYSAEESPVIIIISSMAGGAGASMFLDVSRVLSTLPNGDPANTAVFMYTPEVFEKVDASAMVGAWPNSLAMFGEAFATQTGAANESDRALFSAMGIQGTDSQFTFARVFPIGARMGKQGNVFGDGTPSTIFRGMGRSLTALMFSEQASFSFQAYALGNTGSPAADRSILGWANTRDLAWDRLPWGTWGYAQLSMGRDRYAEYSAQRLARYSFERLLRGHLDPTSTLSGQEQMKSRLDEKLDKLASQNLYLNSEFLHSSPTDATMWNWVGQIFGSFAAPSVQAARAHLRSQLPEGDGRKARDWEPMIRGRLQDQGLAQNLAKGMTSSAYEAVYQFANTIADNLVHMAETQIAEVGVPFTREVLEKLRDTVSNRVVPGLQQVERQMANRNVLAPPPGLDEILQPITGNRTVQQSGVLLDNVAKLYEHQFSQHFSGIVAGYLRPVLEDFSINVIQALLKELNNAQASLEHADNNKDVKLNLADVATDEPNAWPRELDERINDRFRGSHNEILITEVDRFPEDFETQLEETVRASEDDVFDYNQALGRAARSVILGDWDTQGSAPAPKDTLAPSEVDVVPGHNRVRWVCKTLNTAPGSGEAREPRPARFEVKLSPHQLLERARTWILRPNYFFANFIQADLRSYLKDQTVSDVEMNQRLARLREAFGEAMTQARPLAAVSSDMLQAVYARDIEYQYTFSEIPFKEMTAAEQLGEVIANRRNLTMNTNDAFEKSLTQDSKIQTIDVFGSYPNYSPVVFSSLFGPIGEEWMARKANPEGFWNLRRTRPLAGSLPLSNDERKALVAGWIVGVSTGRIYVQDQGLPTAAVHIWDDTTKEWVPFPNPMLTPPSAMLSSVDWMAAVIESVLVAYALVQDRNLHGAVGESLRPYHLLRGLYDDSREGMSAGGTVTHPLVRRLEQFLNDGEMPGKGTYGDGIESRYEFIKQNLTKSTETASSFVEGSTSALPGQVTKKPWARVTSRDYAKAMPLYRDLAPDVMEMVPEIQKHLDDAKNRALNPQPTGMPGLTFGDPMSPPTGGPSFDAGGGLL